MPAPSHPMKIKMLSGFEGPELSVQAGQIVDTFSKKEAQRLIKEGHAVAVSEDSPAALKAELEKARATAAEVETLRAQLEEANARIAVLEAAPTSEAGGGTAVSETTAEAPAEETR